MFIVTRTFRDANGVFPVGSIVDATKVRTFKSRLADKHIVDVNEQNIDHWHTFFLNRYGIDLSATLQGIVSDADETKNEASEAIDNTTDVITSNDEVTVEVSTTEVVSDNNNDW